ncbi:hypothetical protein AB0K09_00400 [Streptomyces sp. NPDC049577]|uniref:hypothetical protein n=1 Tax=Streptomyces sp. NPDC049577 TaxID=3155153 RepID=UPI003445BDFD
MVKADQQSDETNEGGQGRKRPTAPLQRVHAATKFRNIGLDRRLPLQSYIEPPVERGETDVDGASKSFQLDCNSRRFTGHGG